LGRSSQRARWACGALSSRQRGGIQRRVWAANARKGRRRVHFAQRPSDVSERTCPTRLGGAGREGSGPAPGSGARTAVMPRRLRRADRAEAGRPAVVLEGRSEPALEIGAEERRPRPKHADRLQGSEEPLDEGDGAGPADGAVAVADAVAGEGGPEGLRGDAGAARRRATT
jgi:hypothetical protein